MRLLVITRYFPPIIGGISNSLKAISDAFLENGHKVSIFIFPLKNRDKRTFAKGVHNQFYYRKYIKKNFFQIVKDIFDLLKVVFKQKCSFNQKFRILDEYLLGFKKINEFIKMMNFYEIIKSYDKKYNYDVILSYESTISARIGYLLKRSLKKKFFTVSHGNDILRNYNIFTQLILNSANGVIVRSNYIKNLVNNLFKVKKSKIFICTDGIVVDEMQVPFSKNEVREELGMSKEKFYILSVGLLNLVRKGFDLVLKSINELKERFHIDIKNIEYIVVGKDSPSVRNYLLNLAKELKLENNFKIYVNLDNQMRNKFYKASDIFVMPSRDLSKKSSIEGFGNVFIEAGYYNLPVIGSNTGGIPDAIENGKSGFLITNFDELVEKIKLLYENDVLRRQIGEFGYDRVINQFTMKTLYQIYFKILKSYL
jgi:phosphatidylinositol alpha-1,6-mannosyltransferase